MNKLHDILHKYIGEEKKFLAKELFNMEDKEIGEAQGYNQAKQEMRDKVPEIVRGIVEGIEERYFKCPSHGTEDYYNPNGMCTTCQNYQKINMTIEAIIKSLTTPQEEPLTGNDE